MCSSMSTVARPFEVVEAAIAVFSGTTADSSMGRLIDRLDRIFFGSQPSFIGGVRLENTVRNSVKGKYWFPKPTLQQSTHYN